MLTRGDFSSREGGEENRTSTHSGVVRGSVGGDLVTFDLDSASVTGSREGSLVSGITVTTQVLLLILLVLILPVYHS